MHLNELFNKDNPPRPSSLQTEIDIEHNTTAIIYKHQKRKDSIQKTHDVFKKYPPQSSTEELFKVGFSPNHDREMALKFAKYRSKQNIKYQFEKYIVYDKLLGQGSYSKVYLGEAKKTKKLVAIKQVKNLVENQIACLTHSESPYIIKLYEFWNHDKHSYIALELCDGNLRESMEKLSTDEKIDLFQQIVEGMNCLNKKNIIHRDLKFENILLKNGTVKISDFGFAKPIGSKLAVLSEKCGTPYTMAPQIFFHDGKSKSVYTHKCDIYSLGVILHELIYNKHPYEYQVSKMTKNQRVIVNKKFGYLDILIDRSLEHEVARRCNWTEFMQIYTLHTMKRNNQKIEVLKERIKANVEKQTEKYNKTQANPNLTQIKNPKFETPPKKDRVKKQNPFNKIQLPEKENIIQKLEQKKPMPDQNKTQASQLNLIDKKLLQQALRMEHDHYFEEKKENPVETEAISAVKLIFLIIVVFGFIALLHKQFK